MSPCTPGTSARRNVAEIRRLLADFRSGFVFLCESTGVEVMCFDGGGWLGPAGEQRGAQSEKMPENRPRQDINQIPQETPRDTQRALKSASVPGASATRTRWRSG